MVIKRRTPFRNAKNVSTKSVSVVPGVGRLGSNRRYNRGIRQFIAECSFDCLLSNLRSGVPMFFHGEKERLIQLLDYSSAAP